MTTNMRPLTALPTDPNSRYVPTPMGMVKASTPAQFSVLESLNVMTSRPNNNVPARTSRARIGSVQRASGNRAGMRRTTAVKWMRRDQLFDHLDGAVDAGLLKSYSLEGKRDNMLAWSWPNAATGLRDEPGDLAINTGLRGRGNHSMFPKAIAYDGRLSGTAKKTIAGVHFMRHVRSPYSDTPLPWDATLKQGMDDLGTYIGLKRKAVTHGLEECEVYGLLEIETSPRMLSRIRIMPITANYVLLRTPRGYRNMLPHWISLYSGDFGQWGRDEAAARLAYYRETGEVSWTDAQYWAVEASKDGATFPLGMGEELRASFDYGNGKGPVEGVMDDDENDNYDDNYEDESDEGDEQDAVVPEPPGRIEVTAPRSIQDPEPVVEQESVVEPEPPPLDAIELVTVEFQRLARATAPGLPMAYRKIRAGARDWLGPQTPSQVIKAMELFFAGPVHELPPGESLGAAFIARYPDLIRQVIEQPIEMRQTA